MSEKSGTRVPDQRIDDLVAEMTLEEKAGLTIGQDVWITRPVERLGIPSIWLSDGPTGVRKAVSSQQIGMGGSVPATCFPTESALAASWNIDLMHAVGEAIAIECQSQGVQILLAPGVDLKRSPLGGRNFEYYSEDPILSGKLAAAFITGVQSQGVGTSLKHFVANEQETGRMYSDSIVDERTLRELYLYAFEIAVREANPWTLMAAYNLLNGTYCTENRWLLHDILKGEWEYDGIVVSDWLAVNDTVARIDAGCHLQMPGTPQTADVVEGVRSGGLDEARLDTIVRELLAVIVRADSARRPDTAADYDAHHQLARRAAGESIVLLKNEGDVLPLRGTTGRVAVIGEQARTPRFQGAGSSKVNPTKVDNAYDELVRLLGEAGDVAFAPGYGWEDAAAPALLAEAQALARDADIALLFVGLPASAEAEGSDRPTFALPETHNALVEAVLDVQPNVVVVLTNGSAVAMPWADRVPAIVEGWLAGQAGGGAIVDVLLGRVNPSGKLTETFPVHLEDTPAYLSFPGQEGRCLYTEELYTGYRWYDARHIEPLFPFGHGLSYTTFEYEDLSIAVSSPDTVDIACTIRNSGDMAGQEIVQVYVHERQPRLRRPDGELKAFAKVALAPGEEGEVRFQLNRRDFSLYDPAIGGWTVSSSDFEIRVGASSRDVRLSGSVALEASNGAPPRLTRLSPIADWMRHPAGQELLAPRLSAMARARGGSEASADTDAMQRFLAQLPIAKLVHFGVVSEGELAEMIAAVTA